MAIDTSTLSGSANSNWNPITGFPFTMAIVAQHNSLATEGYPFGLCRAGDDASYYMAFRGDLTGDPVVLRRIPNTTTAGGLNTPASSGSFSINTPHSIVVVCASSTDFRIFLDGNKDTSSASMDAPTNATYIFLGAFYSGGPVNTRPGGPFQSAAIWTADLTDDEVMSLVRGFSPRRVRPQSLKYYVPCVRNVTDIRSGVTVSTELLTVQPHHRTYGM